MKKSQALFKITQCLILSGILIGFSHQTLANEAGLASADTSQVVRQLGQPIRKVPEVGEPPISRWVYENKTVYFENNLVLHIVEH
jgi:hypothetical protein